MTNPNVCPFLFILFFDFLIFFGGVGGRGSKLRVNLLGKQREDMHYFKYTLVSRKYKQKRFSQNYVHSFSRGV